MSDLFTKRFIAQLAGFLHHEDFRIKLISLASEMEAHLMQASALSRLKLDGESDETGLTPGQKMTAWIALQLGEIHQLEMISKEVHNLYMADVAAVGMEKWPGLWIKFFNKGMEEGKAEQEIALTQRGFYTIDYYYLVLSSVDQWYDDRIYH